jgi:voltage-dependent calcium channel L type alpha-1D
MLALDSPLNDPDSIFVKCLSVLNVIFSTVFFLECFLKIIAYGFMMHKGSYLRSSWNQLDFFIVVVSLLSLFDFGPGSGLKAFRTVRVLRPLRMIGRNPEVGPLPQLW